MKKTMLRGVSAMLVLLSIAACTSQEIGQPDKQKEKETAAARIVTVPFSIQASVSLGTKVSVDAKDCYTFEEGDEIVISGKNRADVKGLGTYSNGGFKGQLSYDQSVGDDPVLIGTIVGDAFTAGIDYSQAVAADMKKAVEQYSVFSGEFRLPDDSKDKVKVNLSQQSAFIDFELTFQGNKALKTSADVAVVLNSALSVTGTAEIEDGQAGFIVAVPGGTKTEKPSVSLYGRDVEFKESVLQANTRSTVTRNILPVLGDPYYSDGSWGKHVTSEKVIGVVVSVNSAAAQGKTALVMALHEAGSSKWMTGSSKLLLKEQTTNWEDAFVDFDGEGHTAELLQANALGAAELAATYKVEAPKTSTGWFLPAVGQWLAAIEGTGETAARDSWINGDGKSTIAFKNIVRIKTETPLVIDLLNGALANYNGDALTEDVQSYWSSSEASTGKAVRLNFCLVDKNNKFTSSGCSWIKLADQEKNKVFLVRPFLAF